MLCEGKSLQRRVYTRRPAFLLMLLRSMASSKFCTSAIMCGGLAVPVKDAAPALTCLCCFCPGAEETRTTGDNACRQPERGPAQVCNPVPPSKTQNAQAEPGAKPQGQSLAETRAKAVYTAMERSATSALLQLEVFCHCAASLGIAVSRLVCQSSTRDEGA